MRRLTIKEIQEKASSASHEELMALEASLSADQRKGVKAAISKAKRAMELKEIERQRLADLYEFQWQLANKHSAEIIVGIDEVGRGPMAGPLAAGAVVLARTPMIEGLNDSKVLSDKARRTTAAEIASNAIAYAVSYLEPQEIDRIGMTASLKKVFSDVLSKIESMGVVPDIVLLDGNPLHFDEREVNVIKGDMKCASISAASIIAKVARDDIMIQYDKQYPCYGFAENKGYGTAFHRRAIEEHGLCPLHRKSFCGEFLQDSLF